MTAQAISGELWLAPHIHVARDGDDLVILDVAADAYYCLPHAARALSLGAGGACLMGLEPEAVQALRAIGAQADAGVARRAASFVAPARDLGGYVAPAVSARDIWDLALSVIGAALLFRRSSLQDLVEAPRAAAGNVDRARVERRALVFRSLWPWSPLQGACLFQALALRLFLRRGGVDGDWIFGVRTWPFTAHCWMQSGDLVLNDLAERARAYRPILAA